MTRQLRSSLDATRHLNKRDKDSCREDDDFDLEDHDNEDAPDDTDEDHDEDDALDDTDGEGDYDIIFYLDLLMNLSPSMEQVYSQAMKDLVDSMFVDAEDRPMPHIAQPLRQSKFADGGKTQAQSHSTSPATSTDEAACKSIQERFLLVMQKRSKDQNKKLWPKIPIPPVEVSGVRFQERLHHLSEIPIRYEDPAILEKALSVIPVDDIYREAEEEDHLNQAKAMNFDPGERPQLDYQDYVIRALSSATTRAGMTSPSEEEVVDGATRVELYRCSWCGTYVRFPRLSDPAALLKTRRGRLGEWVNCFTLLCRALGARVRYVWCSEDLAWTEVYSTHQDRWVHVDPCEEVWDKPRLYSEGWGTKIAYCIAFSVDGATDVTRRYVRDFAAHGRSRSQVPEETLSYILSGIQSLRRARLDELRKLRLVEEDLREYEELQMYIVRGITQSIIDRPRATRSSIARDDLSPKSPTGSLEWVISRDQAEPTGGTSREDDYPPAYEDSHH
ncbi:MAG: hypothetical protein Q9195_007362 [Heterodermia aff. obscurata]